MNECSKAQLPNDTNMCLYDGDFCITHQHRERKEEDMSWPELKSILLFVPAEEGQEVMAFRNHGELTQQDMFDIAEEWINARPGCIVMYDDDELTPDVRDEPVPEEGLVIDGLYVPPMGLYAPRGGMKWGVRGTNA